MAEYNEQCKKCFHFQVCAQVMKNQLFIREKMLKEENPKCEHFVNAADVVEVVRCKDCKYWQDNNDGYPHQECRWGNYETPDPDDYYSYGELNESREQNKIRKDNRSD
nr:MAG TPA: hypothetical protein [Caudoviricetes sp.]